MRVFMIITVAAFILGGACMVSAEPPWDHLSSDYGYSFRNQRLSQQAFPGGRNKEPIEGLNGQAADKAMKGYYKGYDRSSNTNPNVKINIGDYLTTDN